MNRIFLTLFAAAIAFCSSPVNAGVILFLEDFESGNGNLTAVTGTFGSDGNQDYWDIVNNSNTDRSYTNVQDLNYFGGHDINDIDAAGVNPAVMRINGIFIGGFENLSFSAFFAEQRPEAGGNDDIDAADGFLLEYQIDGGGFQNLIAFENDGTTSNTTFLEDFDFDGDGEGAQLETAFSQFNKSISGTGGFLDLRFTFRIDSGDEDIAIDNIQIEGDMIPAIPEPTSFALFGTTISCLCFRRRKK